MKQESFCVVGVPDTWTKHVPGIETLGAWTDLAGKRHIDAGRLIVHSEMDYDDVFDLAKRMGEQSFLSVDTHGAAHLVWTDGRKPELLGQWREVQANEVVDRGDYTAIFTPGGARRYFSAGGVP